MTAERFAWWIAVLWAFRHAWLAHRKADMISDNQRAANEAGSEILARCVLRIRRIEPFIIDKTTVSASHGFRVGDERFVVTVKRRTDGDLIDG